MAARTVTTEQSKEKTRAKRRYLRRKKGRRKTNRKAAASGHRDASGEREGDEQDSHSQEDENFDIILPPNPVIVNHTGQDLQNQKRSKKRRKVMGENEDVEMGDIVMPMEENALESHPRSPSHTTFPSFPPPALPHPPPKSVLALQGLDQALVDAEVVHPTTLLPIPEGDQDGGTGLSKKMRKRLKDLGVTELFAVQTALLPFLLPANPLQRSLYLPYNPPRDICVSAPTGSGKTLAYVLPIIEVDKYYETIVIRLRALVVLPTRDLVTQVRETFEAVGKARGLKIGIATGQHSFAHEQSQLIADRSSHLQGGSSKVDILICTPGRLMDHLHGTPNFSLQHLRFLVIDEADRLLAQSFQGWLVQVLTATRAPPRTDMDSNSATSETHASHPNLFVPTLSLPYPDSLAPAFQHLLRRTGIPYFVTEQKESSCQKLLFSATLTRDPGKIVALELRDPKYFMVQGSKGSEEADMLDVATEKFSIPSTLMEHMIICEPSQKPLILFYLVHAYRVTNALVFTKSAESTIRLVRLFDFFEKARGQDFTSNDGRQPIVVRAYSSDLGTGERKLILDKFKAQEIQVLVCSDLISRGIDISHVSHVVSYDVPVDMRKYVHRVGRTARAGRTGDAWTLIEEQEARYFKSMLKAADHLENVKRMRLGAKELTLLEPHYEAALRHLKEVYTR